MASTILTVQKIYNTCMRCIQKKYCFIAVKQEDAENFYIIILLWVHSIWRVYVCACNIEEHTQQAPVRGFMWCNMCVCVCGWRWRHYGAVGTPALWHAALSSRDEGCKCEHCRCRCTSHQHAHIIIMMAACFVAKRVALQFKCVYKWNARLVRVVRVR